MAKHDGDHATRRVVLPQKLGLRRRPLKLGPQLLAERLQVGKPQPHLVYASGREQLLWTVQPFAPLVLEYLPQPEVA